MSRKKSKHFEKLEDAGQYFRKLREPSRIVRSYHWASEGYWIEFPPYTLLDVQDSIVLINP